MGNDDRPKEKPKPDESIMETLGKGKKEKK